MAVAHAMADIDKIKMGINLQNMDITLIVKRIDAGDIDGMIATDHNGQRSGGQDSTHTTFNIRVAGLCICVNDISIANIHHPHIAPQIGAIILMVIGPRMAERKQG